jgi:hypothetical protein
VKLFPAPGEQRRLVVLCCILAALGIAAPIVWAVRKREPGVRGDTLAGKTDQGHSLQLMLDERGRVSGVNTRIDSRCKGGHPWWVDWSPRHGWARFTQRGERFRVRELRTQPVEGGGKRRIWTRLVGRVERRRAIGTVRVSARFYRRGVEWQACESGPRRWTAGESAERRLAQAPPLRGPGRRYYPRVPSFAGKISPARRRFVVRTDRTCALTYPATQLALRAVQAAAGDLQRQIEAYGAYVEAHTDQLRALEGLGTPPDGVALHRRWLENFRTRVRLERRVLRLAEAGRFGEAAAVRTRLAELKVRGNVAGQRFGLQVCTSNGPDRTPSAR